MSITGGNIVMDAKLSVLDDLMIFLEGKIEVDGIDDNDDLMEIFDEFKSNLKVKYLSNVVMDAKLSVLDDFSLFLEVKIEVDGFDDNDDLRNIFDKFKSNLKDSQNHEWECFINKLSLLRSNMKNDEDME